MCISSELYYIHVYRFQPHLKNGKKINGTRPCSKVDFRTLFGCFKPGSQYDARASIALRASGWCWNRLDFYSSVASLALASVQPIRLSKNLRDAIWLVKKTFFLWRSQRQRHIVNQALDGKHILIMPPPNSGSYCYNYKHKFSIVLLALVIADYKFLYVDIGQHILRNNAAPHSSLDVEDPHTHIINHSSWCQENHSGGWISLGRQGSNKHSLTAKGIHDYLCDYYVSENSALGRTIVCTYMYKLITLCMYLQVGYCSSCCDMVIKKLQASRCIDHLLQFLSYFFLFFSVSF